MCKFTFLFCLAFCLIFNAMFNYYVNLIEAHQLPSNKILCHCHTNANCIISHHSRNNIDSIHGIIVSNALKLRSPFYRIASWSSCGQLGFSSNHTQKYTHHRTPYFAESRYFGNTIKLMAKPTHHTKTSIFVQPPRNIHTHTHTHSWRWTTFAARHIRRFIIF